jgi:hypothetical protein
MSIVTALLAGGALGIKHAVEADHLAAVATLADDGGPAEAGLVGTSWGVGHSLPVVILGALVVLAGVRVPDHLLVAFEVVVGLIIVALGLRMAVRAVGIGFSHSHGSPEADAHSHRHLALGPLSLGFAHSHRTRVDGDSFAVGAIHGLAGSGVLVVALASAAPTVDAAFGFLAGFTVLTVATMGAVAALWGRVLDTAAATGLKVVAGLLSVAIGAALVAEQVGPAFF